MSPLRDRALPPAVVTRASAEIPLGDPAFEPLPGAHADFGKLRGAVYQIEIPDKWNARLLLWMHGFEEFSLEAHATPPDFRRYLISHGYAWGASSFSSTSLIPGRSADETAALWDYFVRKHGRPKWTYVSGLSMGGWSTNIAAQRYGNRFDGALALCGAAGTTPGLRISSDFVVGAAYVAGVTQKEFDAAPDIGQLIRKRIRPALDDARTRARFEDVMIALTGGPRAFDHEGFRVEEETNWRRGTLTAVTGIVPPRDAPYQLAPGSIVTSAEFNRDAIRLRTNDASLRAFAAGTEVTGDLQMPLVSVHTTGDGQVPIDQAQILSQRVRAKGRGDLLVERIIEDAGHCGFTTSEQEASFAALVDWVERGHKPDGTNVNVSDLRTLDRTFGLTPRPRTKGADDVPGAGERAVLTGTARLDGAAFDAQWIGAVVVDQGLVTPCQTTLPTITTGRFEITIYGERESAGCGRAGTEILLWTNTGKQLWSATAIPWPTTHAAKVSVNFSTAKPLGASKKVAEFFGEVYGADGKRAAPGARVEAYIGRTLCGVATFRSSGFYILSVVGPDSVPGCRIGARITFHVDRQPTDETAVNSTAGSGRQLDLTVQ